MQQIILDIGSAYTKYGTSSSEQPQGVIRSIVGVPRTRFAHEFPQNAVFTGNDPVKLRDKLNIINVVEHGHIRSIEYLDEILNSIYIEEFSGSDYSTVLAIPPKLQRKTLVHYVDTFLDVFQSPSICPRIQGLLTLFSTGQTNGFLLEIGDGVTQAIPIADGSIIPGASERFDFGGCDISAYLQYLLCQKGYPLTATDELQVVRVLKERYCTYNESAPGAIRYTLPDGSQLGDGQHEIVITDEAALAARLLFDPSLWELETPGLPIMIMDGISRSPTDLRTSLYSNILLSGGTSLIDGLATKLQSEIQKLIPTSKTNILSVSNHPDAIYSAWRGGQIMVGLHDAYPRLWISQADYHEQGDSVVNRFAL